MKSLIVTCLALCLIMLATGCDPVYDVDYEVSNISGEKITIYVDHSASKRDTNIISDGTKLVFYNDYGIGSFTDKFMDKLTKLPFEVSIHNEKGVMYKRDAADLSNWTRLYPDKSSGVGKFQLVVTEADFK